MPLRLLWKSVSSSVPPMASSVVSVSARWPTQPHDPGVYAWSADQTSSMASVYSEPPALTPVRYAGTSSDTGTCAVGTRPAFVPTINVASYTPASRSVLSTVTVTVVDSPGASVPVAGSTSSHGRSLTCGTPVSIRYVRLVSWLVAHSAPVASSSRPAPGPKPCSGNSMVEIVAQVSGSSWYRYVVSELLTIHMTSAVGLYASPATETSSGEHWASVSPGLSWDWPATVKMMPWFQPPM